MGTCHFVDINLLGARLFRKRNPKTVNFTVVDKKQGIWTSEKAKWLDGRKPDETVIIRGRSEHENGKVVHEDE